MNRSNLKIITVDPGPFTMYYTKELQKKNNLEKKILMVIGSATETSKNKLSIFYNTKRFFRENES